MQSYCRRCRNLASTEYPCKKCGSESTMAHTHCGETHWSGLGSDEQHSLANCPETHIHPHKGLHDHDDAGATVNDEPPPRIQFRDREAWFLLMPWVSRVRGKVQCEAHTSWAYGKPKNRCKNMAKYRYRPLKTSFMKKGAYCWAHATGVDMNENERIKRWAAKNPPPWRNDEELETYRDRDFYDRRNIDALGDGEASGGEEA